MAFYEGKRLEDVCERATGVFPKFDMPGAKLTTFSIGGPISYFCDIDSVEELKNLLAFLKEKGIEHRTIGAGSNILIPDEGVTDWVLHLGHSFRYCEKTGEASFLVGAAASLMSLSRMLSDDGFSGLEFAAGIPGSLGGALRMNAGAHGASMSDVVKGARILSPALGIVELKASDFHFAYRQSGLAEKAIVLAVHIELVVSDRDKTRNCRAEMLRRRKETQPLKYASAGSVFRNPSPETPAGLLIEKAGLKGTRIGGAEVSQLHANWIINPEKKARASDVRDLMQLCRERVHEMSGIILEPEIMVW